jgi:glycosyltransferase involved in cell wall biosynthesis
MSLQPAPDVAVLLATYNGSRYVEQQIRSLRNNDSQFVLHWLDDHSSDETHQIVRSTADDCSIRLREWHQPGRQGVPGSFFQLLECVEADIYLFCDQDDIWQQGKIDAMVADLTPDRLSPVLCFSDPLLFYEDEPHVFHRMSKLLHIKSTADLGGSRALMATLAAGQAVGITRPLREFFLRHKEIAREHAFMHCWWMYLLANAAGSHRLLNDVPTTLYRQHDRNVTGVFFNRARGVRRLLWLWDLQHHWRKLVARQARGFLLASQTLTPGPQLATICEAATLIAKLDRRQSPVDLIRLVLRGAIVPSWYRMFWLTASCLCSDAKA